MIVIVEGPDNVGKGTQILKIKKYMEEYYGPTHVLHYSNIKGLTKGINKYNLSSPQQELFELTDQEKIRLMSVDLYDQMFQLIKYSSDNEINLILDRAHIGEMVYSPIYRQYSGDYVIKQELKYFHDKDITTEADIWKKVWFNTKLIVFVDNPASLIKRDDGLSFTTDHEKKITEITLFKSAYEKSYLYKTLIDIQGLDENQVWEKVESFLIERNTLELVKHLSL